MDELFDHTKSICVSERPIRENEAREVLRNAVQIAEVLIEQYLDKPSRRAAV